MLQPTENNHTPHFPRVIDSTMLIAGTACPQKFFREYVERRAPAETNVHLHAGGALAKAFEVYRKRRYGEGIPVEEALCDGVDALITFWGDFEAPTAPMSGHQKSLANMVNSFLEYFDHYTHDNDPVKPYIDKGGKPAVEFRFSIPLPIAHPESGEPIIYGGRYDMIGEYGKMLWVVDEKTMSRVEATWSQKWHMRCFGKGTEIYTSTGWMPIENIDKRTEIMQVDAHGNATFTFPKDVIRQKYTGKLINISGSNIAQRVTPNHRILLNKRRGGTKVVEARILSLEETHASIPCSVNYFGAKLSETFQRYLVALQADGSLRPSRGKAESGQGRREHMPTPGASFNFRKDRKRKRLTEMLDVLGAEYNRDAAEIYISGFDSVQATAMEFLDETRTFKKGTEHFYGEEFLKELEYWDGWRNQYYTNNYENALFVQTVAHLNGRGASISERSSAPGNYVVIINNRVSCSLKSLNITQKSYDDEVYCLEVEDGFLLTRYNCKISVSGNSQFLGYTWAGREYGYKIEGAIVRGIAIYEKRSSNIETKILFPQWRTDHWYEQMLRTVQRLVDCWNGGYWDFNYGDACTQYFRLCEFMPLCESDEPEKWYGDYVERHWNPIAQDPTAPAQEEELVTI